MSRRCSNAAGYTMLAAIAVVPVWLVLWGIYEYWSAVAVATSH